MPASLALVRGRWRCFSQNKLMIELDHQGLYDEDDVIVCLLSKSARSARQTERVSKCNKEREGELEDSTQMS